MLPTTLRTTLRALVGTYLAYLALALLIITPALNYFPARYVEDHYSRQLHSEWVILNPFKLSLDWQRLTLSEVDGSDFLAVGESSANLSLASLWRSGVVLDALHITDVSGRIVHLGEGTFNFSDLLPPSNNADKKAPEEVDGQSAMGITIADLQFTATSISIEDRSRTEPYTAQWQDIDLHAQEFSTVFVEGRPYELALHGPGGGRLEWRGDLSIASGTSEGSVTVTDLSLVDIGKIADPWVNFEIDSGRLNIIGNYSINWSDALQYRVDSGKVTLNDLNILPKADADLADTQLILSTLGITGISVESTKQSALIELLNIEGLQIDGWMEGDQISLIKLFAGNAENTASEEEQEEQPEAENPWRVALTRAQLGDSSLNWRSPFTEPAVTQIQNLEASIEQLNWPLAGDSPLTLGLAINETATLNGEGVLNLGTGNGTISYNLSALALPWINPNLPEALKIIITKGNVDLAGRLTLGEFSPDTVALDGAISGFALNPIGSDTVLTGWDAVRLDGLSVNLSERQLTLQRVAIDSYWGFLHIAADGSVNTTNIWLEDSEAQNTPDTAQGSDSTEHDTQNASRSPGKTASEDVVADSEKVAAPVAATEKPWKIDIPEITLTDSLVDFSDQSLPIPFRTVIGDLNGNVLGLSSKPSAEAKVDIKGAVGGSAPVTLRGTVAPLVTPLALDLALNFKGMDMALLTPYSGTYAGYEIERGLLDLQLEYVLAENKLNGENHIVMDQLKLGDKIKSDKAVSAPLELAIAIMTDANGVIDMKLPVRGDVSDPSFQIGSIVFKALLGLIREVVTAPFSLLANLVGSEDDLQHISFPAGSAELNEAGHAKLVKLAGALSQRPGIKLVINGSVNPESDLELLQRNALALELVAQGLSEEDISAKGKAWETAIGERVAALPAPPEGAAPLTIRDQYLKVASTIQLPDAALSQLAQQRALAVKAIFVTEGGLDPTRAVVGTAIGQVDEDGKGSKFSGAELEIN